MKKLRTWAYDHAYKVMVMFALCVLTLGFTSCEDESIEPGVNTEEEALGLYNGEWWYIDTAYTQSQDLMNLSSHETRRIIFNVDNSDTTWVESSVTVNFFDKHTLYGRVGDTLYWEPELAVNPWRAMLIDSLTETRLHFRVVNSSPNVLTSDFSHLSLKYYEYSR